MERGREGGKEGGREGKRERGRERGKEGTRERGKEGKRERGASVRFVSGWGEPRSPDMVNDMVFLKYVWGAYSRIEDTGGDRLE